MTVGAVKMTVEQEITSAMLQFDRTAAVSQTSRSATTPAAADASRTAALQWLEIKLVPRPAGLN